MRVALQAGQLDQPVPGGIGRYVEGLFRHLPDAGVTQKLDLVMRADRAARAYDPRIFQVRASYGDEIRRIPTGIAPAIQRKPAKICPL